MINYYDIIANYLDNHLALKLRADSKIAPFSEGLDFLGYIIRPNYILVRNRVVNNFKYKKAKFCEYYESDNGDRYLKPILEFNQVRNSFLAHIKHANSYRLHHTIGTVK